MGEPSVPSVFGPAPGPPPGETLLRTGVVVPTRNGGARFLACLAALSRQRPSVGALVVIDSESDDGTPEAAAAAGARVLGVRREEFDHGETRNRGAAAVGEVDALVFLVQDAVPQGEGCLAALVSALGDAQAGAATARQTAPPEAGWLTACTVERSPFASGTPRRTGPFPRAELEALSPRAWRGRLLLDDVACAVRGALFRAAGGFVPTSHGEDVLFAHDLLCAGWALVHEPRALVEHGHAYDARSVRARYRDDAVFFRERFGLRVRPTALSSLKGYLAETRADRAWLARHPEHDRPGARRESARLRRAQLAAQREGSRGPLGRRPAPRPLPAPPAAAR